MGWWTDGEGAKGFFSDDLCIPEGWTRLNVETSEETVVVPAEPEPKKVRVTTRKVKVRK